MAIAEPESLVSWSLGRCWAAVSDPGAVRPRFDEVLKLLS